MLSFHKVKPNPGEIQYSTAVASLFAQLPLVIVATDPTGWSELYTPDRLVIYLFNGICFHFQTLSGYALMDAVSPVTHSVANVAKRAILIWVSVMIFKNKITFLSGLGTSIVSMKFPKKIIKTYKRNLQQVFLGVLWYNKARQ